MIHILSNLSSLKEYTDTCAHIMTNTSHWLVTDHFEVWGDKFVEETGPFVLVSAGHDRTASDFMSI